MDEIDELDDSMLDDEEAEFVPRDERRNIILIIYDIVDNKRRNRMVKALEGFGVRVQKSAFEAYLTKKKYDKLLKRVPKIIDNTTDSLRIYTLSSSFSVRSWGIGDRHTDDVIII